MAEDEKRQGAAGTRDRKILVCVDGSENSRVAAAFAARLARLTGAHLSLLHVLHLPTFSHWVNIKSQMKREIREQAEAMVGEIAKGVEESCGIMPEFFILEGLPRERIIETAQEDRAIRMVVVGASGEQGHRRSVVAGSLARHLGDRLTTDLPCPLLVVPPHMEEDELCEGIDSLVR
ncbi:universal stress protein [Thiohalorhabdus sp. Cl-TMA]|uniref:Universal stress protein n=1 Tax=Thiohalorhabdus methylotrophus TaxID=3242694 RepID=A0ABV4TTJ5_9GAMM